MEIQGTEKFEETFEVTDKYFKSFGFLISGCLSEHIQEKSLSMFLRWLQPKRS
jgi:hypothetical protein